MQVQKFRRAFAGALVALVAMAAGPFVATAAAETTVVFSDNFDDGNLDGWNGGFGAQCDGSGCVAADTPHGYYWDYYSNSMSRQISLPAGSGDCQIDFDWSANTEWGYDYVYINVNSASGSYTPVYTSGWHGWQHVTLPVGGTSVDFNASIWSDYSVWGDGLFIDNVTIKCGAATPQATRWSGQGGTPGQQDGNTTFSRDGGLTWQPAWIVDETVNGRHPWDGASWDPVDPRAAWINCEPSYNACLGETIRYRTYVVLPAEGPYDLHFSVVADNAATALMNGTQVGARFETTGELDIPEGLLHPGINTFEMIIEDWGGAAGFQYDVTGNLDADAVVDADNDGVLDGDDNCVDVANGNQADTDTDGLGDVCDTDDDGDLVPDAEDAFPLDATETVDTDNDGIGNNADVDDDNDGVNDANDAAPLDATETVDTDNDGIGNNADVDDDGDGANDATDAFPLDPNESLDTDNDGIGNNADVDDDNDGANDANDALPLDPNESLDTDNDGTGNNADVDDDGDLVADGDDAFPLDATETVDTDNDGIGNNADVDDDNDGVNDANDALPLDPTESVDTDNDGTGNNADVDDDGDLVSDSGDAFPLDPTETVDTDHDGIGNNADVDDDNDGVNDANDAFPLNSAESVDTDGDGTGNNADTDDDNDGLSDVAEAAAGTNPLDGDSDNDGSLDGVDALPLDANVGTVPLNTAGVCAVLRGFVTKAGIANSLCAKLGAATASKARLSTNAQAGQLKAFDNELRAQTGKSITASRAASVRALVNLIL
jgi:hypothetical protein